MNPQDYTAPWADSDCGGHLPRVSGKSNAEVRPVRRGVWGQAVGELSWAAWEAVRGFDLPEESCLS